MMPSNQPPRPSLNFNFRNGGALGLLLFASLLVFAILVNSSRRSPSPVEQPAESAPVVATPSVLAPVVPLFEVDAFLTDSGSAWPTLNPLSDEYSQALSEAANLAALEISLEAADALALASRPEAVLETHDPEKGSSGHLIMVGRQRVLHIRGELPSAEAKNQMLDLLSQSYENWRIEDEIRVDSRLCAPAEGTLLTRRSLPSAEVAAGSGLICVAAFGDPWSHITLDKPTGLTTADLGLLGLTAGSPRTHRKLIDFQVLLPFAMDFTSGKATVAASLGN